MSIGALVCGIVSVVVNCCFIPVLPTIVAIVGIVLGIISIKNKKDGKNLAIIGIVLSGIGLLVSIAAIIGCAALFTSEDFLNEINGVDWEYTY
jgi:hypothetical protein